MSALSEFNPIRQLCVGSERIVAKGLTVVVGPNNSGKTRLLREIGEYVRGRFPRPQVVTKGFVLSKPNSFDNFIKALQAAESVRTEGDGINLGLHVPGSGSPSGGGSINYARAKQEWETLDVTKEAGDTPFYGWFGHFLLADLNILNRLRMLDDQEPHDIRGGWPQHDLQLLWVTDEAKKTIAKVTGEVFGNAAFVATRDKKLQFLCSQKPVPPTHEEQNSARKLMEYPTIAEEGEGYKSYVSIMVSLIIAQRPVVLIDEPEAYLHPPQAYRLGRFIGENSRCPDDSIFVATHSAHVLRGILDGNVDAHGKRNLRLLRMFRKDRDFFGNQFSPEELEKILKLPITRKENTLDGLFSEAVAVVEADGDRDVYETVLEVISTERKPQIHFVPVAGNAAIKHLLRVFKDLKIPVVAIVDRDTLRETDRIKGIVSAAGGDGEAAAGMSVQLVAAVSNCSTTMTPDEVRARLEQINSLRMEWSQNDELHVIRRLKDLASDLKRSNLITSGDLRAALAAANAAHAHHAGDLARIKELLDELINLCKASGVFVVLFGRLEDWLPDLMAGKSKNDKQEWANEAVKQLKVAQPRGNDVWQFIQAIADYLQNAH